LLCFDETETKETENEYSSAIMWEHFVSATAGNLPISGKAVEEHAQEVAKKLEKSGFRVPNG
jgi:hypothetical protein